MTTSTAAETELLTTAIDQLIAAGLWTVTSA